MRKYYVYFEGQDELLTREGVNELRNLYLSRVYTKGEVDMQEH